MSPRNVHTCLAVIGGCMLFIAWVFDGSGLMSFVLRMCLRYWISLVKKWHLLSLIDRCAFHKFLKKFLYVIKMFFCCPAENDDVIQVSDCEGEFF